jgi:hypothetical protein
MIVTVKINENERNFVISNEVIEKYSVLSTSRKLVEENDVDTFTLDITHIKGITFVLFETFLEIVDAVKADIDPHREDIEQEAQKAYKMLYEKVIHMRSVKVKESPEKYRNLTGVKLINAIIDDAETQQDKVLVSTPDLKRFRTYHLKLTIHKRLHGSALFAKYKSLGKDLVYIINLSHYLGECEVTHHMAAFMLYIFAKEPKNSNRIYENGKQYNDEDNNSETVKLLKLTGKFILNLSK